MGGFTLFELLITIFLIVSALFPLLSFLSSSLAVSGSSESEMVALNLAQAKMEELKSLSFGLITSESKASVPGYPGHQREVLVSTPASSLKDIMVYVYWTPSGGSEEHVSFESYVANF